MTTVTQMNLRSVRSADGAVDLLRLLAYETAPLPYDAGVLGLDGASALRMRSDRSQARGYGVLIAELDRAPRSLRTLGRVNYDLHFNPQVAVQRAGRIDRLGSPHRVVDLVSFLPPEPLEADAEELGPVEVSPQDIRLVAWEDLVTGPARGGGTRLLGELVGAAEELSRSE